MTKSAVPFNVSLLHLTPKRLEGLKPVTVTDTLEGASRNFNENGLFSVSIFGRVGDERRNRRFSFIDIKVAIFHPVIYRALGQLSRMYPDIIAGKQYATWNDTLKDFEKSDEIYGETGYNFFVSHWLDIEFKETNAETRMLNIQLLKKFHATSTMDKIIVMPAGLRDVEVTPDGRMQRDEINDFYLRLISYSNSIPQEAVRHSSEVLDRSRLSIQLAFNDIYDLLEKMIDGKKKLILGKWASRKVFNGTRNVITPTHINSDDLNDPANIGLNDTVVGLYQFMKSSLPVTKYNIKTGFLSKVFTGPGDPARLINKKTLKSEMIRLNYKYFDTWMTDEGIEKIVSAYSEESIRHTPIEIEGYYLGLLYNDPSGFVKLFQGIEDLPKGFNKDFVSPVTFTEFLYLQVYHFANTLPAFITRYPITGLGSIYPSMNYLKPTVVTKTVKILDDNWEVNGIIPDAICFPVRGAQFTNSMSPSSLALGGLTADFDGKHYCCHKTS